MKINHCNTEIELKQTIFDHPAEMPTTGYIKHFGICLICGEEIELWG